MTHEELTKLAGITTNHADRLLTLMRATQDELGDLEQSGGHLSGPSAERSNWVIRELIDVISRVAASHDSVSGILDAHRTFNEVEVDRLTSRLNAANQRAAAYKDHAERMEAGADIDESKQTLNTDLTAGYF